jgi:hypothetical protein
MKDFILFCRIGKICAYVDRYVRFGSTHEPPCSNAEEMSKWLENIYSNLSLEIKLEALDLETDVKRDKIITEHGGYSNAAIPTITGTNKDPRSLQG